MLESTGSHGRGVEQRVPEMRRMVEFQASRLVRCMAANCNFYIIFWLKKCTLSSKFYGIITLGLPPTQ